MKKFHYVYEHVQNENFPHHKDSISAKQTVELLWFVTMKIFKADDLQKCEEFCNYFYPSKVLLNTKQPLSTQEATTTIHLSNTMKYHSCVFENDIVRIR